MLSPVQRFRICREGASFALGALWVVTAITFGTRYGASPYIVPMIVFYGLLFLASRIECPNCGKTLRATQRITGHLESTPQWCVKCGQNLTKVGAG